MIRRYFFMLVLGVVALIALLFWWNRKKWKLKIINNPPRRYGGWLAGGSMLLILICFACNYAAAWYNETYGELGFDAILYTMTANLGGVDPSLIKSCLMYMLTRSKAPFWVAVTLFILFSCKRKLVLQYSEKRYVRIYPFVPWMKVLLTLVVCGFFLSRAAYRTDFMDFVRAGMKATALYEEEYRAPAQVQITFPEQKRNLIYLYLESMENTFLDEEHGGALPYNTIPELTQLVQENVSFSHNTSIGGFCSPPGTTWTIGAMVGHTAGIPLKTPIGEGGNDYGADGNFLPGVTTITDILHDNGYSQAIVFGSDAVFGGRLQYFSSHGVDQVYDYISAAEDKIIEEGYNNGNWGMDDFYLFDYAKLVLSELAQEPAPFAITILTADTHFPDGQLCPLCEDTYAEQYENVYRCSSAQVDAFLEWCRQQPWYENTTIVIVGDHPTMDGAYIMRNVPNEYDRRVYNCIINSASETENTKNREFSTFDMFPTTLAAIGCKIDGDRLGLGTNLFSNQPTLLEKMGKEQFEQEVSVFSSYYAKTFW